MALSPSAYFFGKDLIQVPRLALLTVTFAVPFYTLTTPSPSLTYYWIVLVLVAYVVSGYSYIASMLAGPKDVVFDTCDERGEEVLVLETKKLPDRTVEHRMQLLRDAARNRELVLELL